MRLLSALTTAALAVGALGVLAAPAAAADPVVDIAVERTLNTPTDVFDISPTRPADADISLSNLGEAAQDASFSFPVPAGWTVAPAFDLGSDETCGQTAGVYTCSVTALPVGIARSTQLLVTAAPATPVDSVTTVVVTAEPVGAVDANPDNNTTQFRFRNVGTSDVVGTITQSATTVGVGGTVTFSVRITNNGPNPTVGQSGGFRIVTDTVDGFRQAKPVGPGTVAEGGGESAPNAGPDYTFSYDLAAGASATYVVTWTGLTVGAVGHLRFASDHQPGARDATGLVLLNSRDVTVVTTTGGLPTNLPNVPTLANTGASHTGGQVLTALVAVAFGAMLVAAARRRPGRHAA